METTKFRSCFLTVLIFFGMQSLADIAREEAERRKSLEERGIKGKVIENIAASASSGIDLTESEHRAKKPADKSSRASSSKKRPSVSRYRSALQKLDRTIRQEEARLKLLRERLRKERWAPPKTGRLSARGKSEEVQNRLRDEIEDLQVKIKLLRRERAEIYDEGKKAGFLPGELEGKGIIP
jgi:hypothetical protein